jgi:hypothetical protein
MPRSGPGEHSSEWAEMLAIQALSVIASDADHLGGFLAESGIGPESLREAASDPAFLAGVLDHVMRNEELLLAVAGACQVRPDEIGRARSLMAGAPRDRDIP